MYVCVVVCDSVCMCVLLFMMWLYVCVFVCHSECVVGSVGVSDIRTVLKVKPRYIPDLFY